MRFGFGLDDVGTGTCVAVECPDPVVIERTGSQSGRGAYGEVLVPRPITYTLYS